MEPNLQALARHYNKSSSYFSQMQLYAEPKLKFILSFHTDPIKSIAYYGGYVAALVSKMEGILISYEGHKKSFGQILHHLGLSRSINLTGIHHAQCKAVFRPFINDIDYVSVSSKTIQNWVKIVDYCYYGTKQKAA